MIQLDKVCLWQGYIHPKAALDVYNGEMGVDAKLCSVGMVATNSTINEPDNPNMLDVVGFSSNTPSVISDFVSGKI